MACSGCCSTTLWGVATCDKFKTTCRFLTIPCLNQYFLAIFFMKVYYRSLNLKQTDSSHIWQKWMLQPTCCVAALFLITPCRRHTCFQWVCRGHPEKFFRANLFGCSLKNSEIGGRFSENVVFIKFHKFFIQIWTISWILQNLIFFSCENLIL